MYIQLATRGKESAPESSPSNHSDDAVVVDKNMFEQVAKAVQELKISRGDFQRIDSKFTKTAQEVANDKHINAHPALLAYKTYTQKVWNELFLAAVLMNSGRFQIDATSNTESAAKYVLQSLTQSLPVASTLMSIVCGTHDALKAARLKGGFQNVSKLSPSSDVVIFGNLSDHIASECTLAYHSEINNSAFIKEKTRFSKMKGAMINAVSKIDDKFARGFFENKDLNDTQCVALDHASICAAHLMSMKTSDIDAIDGDSCHPCRVLRHVALPLLCTCDVLVAPRRRDRTVQRCERARGAARGGRTRSCRWWRTRRVCGECGGGWGGGWRGGLSRVGGGAFDAYGAVRHAVRLARCRLHRHSSLCGHHVQSAFWVARRQNLTLGEP